ncbi:MAG: LamG domain-containing protein [Kiritimatiellales bacterium]|nr:LamG domain-containing protein [Kiritimatiellales bacterium]
MKFRFYPFSLIFLAVFLAGFATRSSADVGFTLEIWHGYDFYYPGVSLTASSPAPVTYDRVESPNGIIWQNFGTNNDSNAFFLTNDLSVVLNECNGLWKLYLNKGDGSEQLYHFTVSIAGVTTNLFGDATIVYPAYGSSVLENPPTFSWTGPANLPLVNVDAYQNTGGNFYYDVLPGTATNWTPSGLLSPGTNNFFINYHSNNVAGFSFTAPTNSSGTLGGWAAQGDVFSYNVSTFVVVSNSAGGGGGGHTNVAYYSFEDDNIFATDYSTNGNNVSSVSSFGDGTAYTTNVQTLGSYAAFFSNNGGSGASWLNPPTNLLATLAGSFSISLWVNTTQATGSDTDDGLYGNAGLVSAFNGSGNNWVVPMAITGNKVTFSTGGSSENYLHSASDINIGSYVHLVVTRNQSTGEKKIYVNGTLDAMGTGSTDLLDTPTELNIGYSNGTGFDGRMDEIQIYSGELSSNEVLQLYNNPGTVIPDVGGDFNAALNTTNLTWTVGGNTSWFIETTNTYDGVSAAQSGVITDGQTNWIAMIVPADGQLSFYWKVSSEADFDFLRFYINGIEQDSISGEVDWNQASYTVSAGDTLRWEYSKDESVSEGSDAGWLDKVVLPVGFTTPYPVDVDLQLTIARNQDPDSFGDYYTASVSFNSVSPEAATTNSVSSPHSYYHSEQYPGGGSGGSAILGSLDAVINECTNGLWSIYINEGTSTQQVYSFQVSISGLDTNLLTAVEVFAPANGAVNVATNPEYHWIGPSNFTTLVVDLLSGPVAGLPVAATNWPSAPTLSYGPERFDVDYTSNNFPGITFSPPVDALSNPLRTWAATANLVSAAYDHFVVGAPEPLPVELVDIQPINGTFRFSFQTLAGRPHTVQVRTNLTSGTWSDLTNFTGNGSLQQFVFPSTNYPISFFRVNTQ